MEVRKIASLPLIDAAGESTNVIVEEDGVAKRIPSGTIVPNVEDAILQMLASAQVINPAADSNGALFTDESNKVYLI